MELKDFLIKAKKATYANASVEKSRSLAPWHELLWCYFSTFDIDGDLARFDGVEEIRKNGELVYKLRCTGGKII